MRRLLAWAPYLFWTALGFSAALYLPAGIETYHKVKDLLITTVAPPISIPDATAQWVSDREFDITAPAFYWTDTCPSIAASWWVQTRWNGTVPVTTKGVHGPLAARGVLPPRYILSITPQVGPPLQIRVTIPDWLPPEDVLLVGVDDTVADNAPCASGWSGVIQVFRLLVKSP